MAAAHGRTVDSFNAANSVLILTNSPSYMTMTYTQIEIRWDFIMQ